MTTHSSDALRAALLASVGPYQRPRFDPAPLRAALLAMPPDARASLLLERLQTYARSAEFAHWSDFPAACFVIDVTVDAQVATSTFAMIHQRLTARQRKITGVALKDEDFTYYAALLRGAGPARTPYVTALLTWHGDDASIAAVVLDTLTHFADANAVEAMSWVARFDKGNRTRAVALLAALGDDALDTIAALAGSDEPAAREVALRALAAMPSRASTRRMAARVRARAKGVPKAVKDAIVAMANEAGDEAPAPLPPPMAVLPPRVSPRLPDLPDVSRVEGDLRALDVEADAVPEAQRAAFEAALEAGDLAAIDACVDAIGAPALRLTQRWCRTSRIGDFDRKVDHVARVVARVPVTPGTAAAAVAELVSSTDFAFRTDATPLIERFAEHLLAPAAVAMSSKDWMPNRHAVIAALARHHPTAAHRLFLEGLREVKCWDVASRALEAIGADAIEGCAAVLLGKDEAAAHGAARHFERIADPAALSVIEQALPRVRSNVHDNLRRAFDATLRARRA